MQTLEQDKRETYQDQAAEEWEFALSELTQLVQRWGKSAIAKELSKLPEIDVDMWKDWVPSCDECVNWRADQQGFVISHTFFSSTIIYA